jgi:hypothetical protein
VTKPSTSGGGPGEVLPIRGIRKLLQQIPLPWWGCPLCGGFLRPPALQVEPHCIVRRFGACGGKSGERLAVIYGIGIVFFFPTMVVYTVERTGAAGGPVMETFTAASDLGVGLVAVMSVGYFHCFMRDRNKGA